MTALLDPRSEPSSPRPSRTCRAPNRTPIFLGQRRGDDLARAYAAFDVFVHTGTRETFGQTLQEAAAMGLPVAPARGGPIDLVDHGRSGYLFDPDRPGALRGRGDARRRPTIASVDG